MIIIIPTKPVGMATFYRDMVGEWNFMQCDLLVTELSTYPYYR